MSGAQLTRPVAPLLTWSSCRLAGVTRSQAGSYLCQANNSVGRSEPRPVDIVVKCEYPLHHFNI